MNGIAISIFIVYMALVLFIGYIGLKKTKNTPEGFFVANRSIGPILLFFTFAATNFSAFFFFGFAGAAYKYGFGYYGVMAIGTTLMALAFFYLGRRIWRAGKGFSLITPPELFGVRYKSEPLRVTVLAVFVLFTIPYVATQAIGGGIALQTLTDGAISFQLGAIIVTAIITAYLMMGGMMSDVLTDLLQGVVMLIGALAAVGFIAVGLGGFDTANNAVHTAMPNLFSLPGGVGYITIPIWISFILLWTFADPMFPHLFQRFYIAKNERAIRFTMVAYPIITMVLFLCPVLIGVWGHGVTLTGLTPTYDNVLPLMAQMFAPDWVFGLVMAAGFAALMSTADSQLLVLSSMLTRDASHFIWKGKQTPQHEVRMGRIIIFAIALVSLAVALSSFYSIFDLLTKTTFTGLALLFPTTIAVLYWKGSTAWGCISSVVVGESLYAVIFALSSTRVIASDLFFGFLPAIPLVIISTVVLIVVSRFTKKPEEAHVKEFFKHVEGA
jgi:SSS family solute:Na+ symporter